MHCRDNVRLNRRIPAGSLASVEEQLREYFSQYALDSRDWTSCNIKSNQFLKMISVGTAVCTKLLACPVNERQAINEFIRKKRSFGA